MERLAILHVPRPTSWADLKQHRDVAADFVVTRESFNDRIELFEWNHETHERCIVGYDKQTSAFKEFSRNSVKVRIYDHQQFEREKNLTDALKDHILIIVECNGESEHKFVRDTIMGSGLKERVMFTSQESGDISFMPLEMFKRTQWIVTAETQTQKKNTALKLDILKNEIFTADIQRSIDAKLVEIFKLLQPNKYELLCEDEFAKRIIVNKEAVQCLLKEIELLQKLKMGDFNEKEADAKNSYWKKSENGDQQYSELNKYSSIFLAIRNVCLKIVRELIKSKNQLQMFDYAQRLSKNGQYESFQRNVSVLLGVEEKKLEKTLNDHCNCDTFQLPQRNNDRSFEVLPGILKVKQWRVEEMKNKIFILIMELENEESAQEKLREFVGQASEIPGISKVEKQLQKCLEIIASETSNIPPEYQQSVRRFAFEALADGMKQALDGTVICLEEFLDKVPSIEKDSLQKNIRKKLYTHDLKKQTEKYRRVCKDSDAAGAAVVLRLVVLSSDSYAEDISKEDVERTFHTGKWSHSGPDFISKRMIRTYFFDKDTNAEKLLQFANEMFRTFEIPDKVGETTLRLKYDKWKENYQEYKFRPISMTTQLFNLLDKVVHLRLLDWEYVNGGLPELSFAYQKRKSAPLCRFKLLTKIAELVNSKSCWHAVSLDFKKAYEKVNPSKLCQIMANKGVPSKIISWVWYTLRRRKFSIDSNETYTRTGVPQGSALSPLLFNIYTAHIHDIVKGRNNVFLYQYTDDILVLASASKFDEAKSLAENVCFEVIESMTKYDALEKNKSVKKLCFVGLTIRIPENADECHNIESVFDIYFEDMKQQINDRMGKLKIENAVDGWQMYHTRLLPLFKKTFLSIEVLRQELKRPLRRWTEEIDTLRETCHKKCLGLEDGVLPAGFGKYGLLWEFGDLPVEHFMELEYKITNTRFGYYDKNKETHPFPGNILDGNNQRCAYVASTDGSVLKLAEGKYGAGAGVFFEQPEHLKLKPMSVRLRADIMIGTAEMVASVIAIKAVKCDLENNQKRDATVMLYSDRREVVLQLNKTGKTRHTHRYAEEFKKIARQLPELKIYLQWKSRNYNNEADRLAKKAAMSDNAIDDNYEMSLADEVRKYIRDARQTAENHEHMAAYSEKMGTFRRKPWFQSKRIKAIQLEPKDFQLYLKDRLTVKLEDDGLKALRQWEYYFPGYAEEC